MLSSYSSGSKDREPYAKQAPRPLERTGVGTVDLKCPYADGAGFQVRGSSSGLKLWCISLASAQPGPGGDSLKRFKNAHALKGDRLDDGLVALPKLLLA